MQDSITEESEAKSRRILDAGAISVSWLMMVACVHVMYVGFVLYGSKPRTAAVLATLTQNGKQWYLPERELPIYVVGCALTLVLSISSAYFWQRMARRQDQDDPGFSLRGCLLSLLLAAVAGGFNLSWLLGIRLLGKLLGLPRPLVAIVLILPAAAEVILFYISQKQNTTGALQSILAHVESELKGVADRIRHIDSTGPDKVSNTAQQRKLYRLIDAGVILFICFVIYIPRTDLLAGSDYLFQHFHHWDYFAMGPAIGLVKGRHLATQVYCQYGFGWPLLLAKLDPVFRLSYGHAYKIAVIYGCAYYCGLYWLLRRLLPNPAWAIAGLMLALRLQVFHGGEMDVTLWCIPGTSILRTPCDVWVLLLLLAHWRFQRPIWLLMAGGLVGLSLLFIIDTGVYLTVTFVGYNLLWLASAAGGARNKDDPSATSSAKRLMGQRIRTTIAALIVAALVLIAGMTAASGSAVFSPGYVRQWLEVLWLYPSGISMLPMIAEPAGVMFSNWFILLFLAHMSAGIVRFCSGNRQAEDVVVLCIAALGLLYLIYYIGNSHIYSMFQLSTPFCIVVVYTAERITATMSGYSMRFGPRHEQIAPMAVAIGATLVLLLNPQIRGYPGLFRSILMPPPHDVVCYLADVCVAAEHHPNLVPFQRVASEMRTITSQGKTVAVIANDDTSLYVASRATLWYRYTPLLPSLMTQSMLAEVNRELSTRPVDCVFLKKSDPTKDGFWAGSLSPLTTDSWTMLSDTTHRLYHFDHECGPYEVWRR